MRITILGIATLFSVACGHNHQNVECEQTSDCNLSGGGMCLTGATGMWCAYPDPGCPSGYRYSTQDIGDGLSGHCVPDGLSVDAGVDSHPPDAAPSHFVVTYGGSGAESVSELYPTNDGVVAIGSLSSNAMLGTYALTFGGGYAFIVAKLGVDGSVLWAQSKTTDSSLLFTGGGGTSPAGDVIVGGIFTGNVNLGGAILAGAGGYDAFLAKFRGADGSHMWSVRYGTASDERVQATTVDAAGDIYVAGAYTNGGNYGGGVQTSAGSLDVFVAKYSGTDGSYVWGVHAGGAADDVPRTIAVAGGLVTVGGVFRNTINFGGSDLTSAGSDDIFVATFNAANGSHVWSKRFGSSVTTSNDNCASLTSDGTGIYLTGSFVSPIGFGGATHNTQGSSDIYVAKLDATTGAYVWSKAFGETGGDVPTRVVLNGSSITITGYFSDSINFGGADLPSAGGTDIFVASLKQSDGSHVDSFRSGGSANDLGTALAPDPNGLIVGGAFAGVTYFGTTQASSGGSTDGFVFRP